jgi:hypothetical protein
MASAGSGVKSSAEAGALDRWERRDAFAWSGWSCGGVGEPAGEIALQSGQIVATTAVADVTGGANEVLRGTVDAEAHEHLPANVVEGTGRGRAGHVVHGERVGEHGVNGQAQVIKGMQQIITTYTLLQDKAAMSEAVANVRWLIAAGIRDFQAMLEELGKLQTGLPRDAPAPDEPVGDD